MNDERPVAWMFGGAAEVRTRAVGFAYGLADGLSPRRGEAKRPTLAVLSAVADQ